MPNGTLDISALESWLWEAACIIRGPIDAPKFKDYILPLIFLKRLSDVYEDELAQLGPTAKFVDKDHSLVRFYVPPGARWPYLQQQTTGLGELLTDAVRAVARENPKLHDVIDIKDFNETAAGQRILSDEQLRALVQLLSQHRLVLKDVEPDILGRAYEYLIRKFAEGQGQSAGEFYTPREVAVLMARILDPEPGEEIYDPACGSSGLLIKSQLRFREKYGSDPHLAPLRFYGQEINPATFAMLPILPVLARAPRRYLKHGRPQLLHNRECPYLLVDRNRTAMSRQAIWHRIRALSVEALGQSRSPHKLRAGFCTALNDGGMDVRSVQSLMRHADLSTTQRYINLDVKQLRRAYYKSFPRAKQ